MSFLTPQLGLHEVSKWFVIKRIYVEEFFFLTVIKTTEAKDLQPFPVTSKRSRRCHGEQARASRSLLIGETCRCKHISFCVLQTLKRFIMSLRERGFKGDEALW